MLASSLDFQSYKTLFLKLREVKSSRLILLKKLIDNAYIYNGKEFLKVLSAGKEMKEDTFKNITSQYQKVFVSNQDYEKLQAQISENLTRVSRSLSMKPPLQGATNQAFYLSLNMSSLYEDPLNDQLLQQQFQSSYVLGSFLIDNIKIHQSLFDNIIKQHHDYHIEQPLLSSLLTISFLQASNTFSRTELIKLFQTSYFKDLGMGIVPKQYLTSTNMSDEQKSLLSSHSKDTVTLLENRVDLSDRFLSIMEQHHQFNEIVKAKLKGSDFHFDSNFLTGSDSIIINAMDVIVAMTHKRPYRGQRSLYDALELLKKIIKDDYPQEFKSLVLFLKNFFPKK